MGSWFHRQLPRLLYPQRLLCRFRRTIHRSASRLARVVHSPMWRSPPPTARSPRNSSHTRSCSRAQMLLVIRRRSSSSRSTAARASRLAQARWLRCPDPVRGAATCSATALPPPVSHSPSRVPTLLPTSPESSPTPAAGITAEVGTVDHSTGDGDEDESSASARVSVKFTNATGDQSRTLTIKVKR